MLRPLAALPQPTTMEINRLVLPQRDGLGDTSETTAAKGRARFRYLEETSSVRDPREAGMERYASGLGRDTLSLVRSCEVGYETTDPSALSKGDASDDEDDNDSADSDDEKPPPAAAPVSHVDAEGHGRGAEDLTAEEKQTNLMMDMDWDTTQWSLREIEAACSALVQEIKDCPLDGPGQKRRDYSQQMLLRLCNRHVEALYYFERVLESMVNHSLPGLSYGLDQHALNLAPLLAAMAPIHDYAQRLLDIKTIRRVIDILLVEPNLAANIIQCAVHMRFFCDPNHHHYASRLPDGAPEAEVLLHEKENRERCRRKYFAKCMEHEALVNKWKRAKVRARGRRGRGLRGGRGHAPAAPGPGRGPAPRIAVRRRAARVPRGGLRRAGEAGGDARGRRRAPRARRHPGFKPPRAAAARDAGGRG
jgi:hypothetical protein